MKYKSIYTVIFVVAMLFITSCGKSEGTSSSGTKVLFSYSPQEGNPFRTNIAEAAKNQIESEGGTLEIVESEHSIEKQVEQFKSAKSNGYGAIICIPEDAATARQLIAAADGLPVVFINAAPDDDVLEEDQYIYVGSNEEVAGQYQAEYVLENSKDKSEINVVILKGERGHSATKGRTQAAKKVFEESGKNVTIVFEDYAEWDTAQAKALFHTFLSTGRKADYVLANNDAMALGVVEAYKENNIDFASAPILGVDATVNGCESIQENKMQFTVYQSASVQGEYAAKAAAILAAGESISELEYADKDKKHVWVPFEKVTSDNVSKYIK